MVGVPLRITGSFRLIRLCFFTAAMAAVCNDCASGDRPLDAVDPQAVPQNPTYDQVFAIVHNRCATCHDGGGGESEGEYFRASELAIDVPPLTTCTDIVALRDDIVTRVEDNTMPPGAMPRLSSAEKLLIRRWVENGAPAPCN
jgi:uncharacterized membrane protein